MTKLRSQKGHQTSTGARQQSALPAPTKKPAEQTASQSSQRTPAPTEQDGIDSALPQGQRASFGQGLLGKEDAPQRQARAASFISTVTAGRETAAAKPAPAPRTAMARQLIAASDKDHTIDGAEMEAALKVRGEVSQSALLDDMYTAVLHGRRFTGRARAVASKHVGGFDVKAVDDKQVYGRMDANEALIDLDRLVHGWSSGEDKASLGQVEDLRGWVQQAVVAAEHPQTAKAYVGTRLTEALASLKDGGGDAKAVADKIQGVVDELGLDKTLPAGLEASREMVEQGFVATEWRMAWKQEKRLATDPLMSDFVGMMNDLIADGSLEQRDVSYLTSYFEQFQPSGFFSRFLPDNKFFKRQELEGFAKALDALPDKHVAPGARQKLRGWIDDQLKKAPDDEPVYARQSELRLPGEGRQLSASSLQEIASDPRLVDRYIQLLESGERDPYELYFYGQQGYKPEDPLADYALANESVRTFSRLTSVLVGGGKQLGEDEAHYERLKTELGDFARNPLDEEERRLNQKKPLVAPETPMPGSLDDKTNPLRVPQFKEMLTQVIAEERKNGIEPKAGKVHTWGKQFSERYKNNFLPFTLSSKLLAGLAKGTTWKYMATGKETELVKWMLDQPHNSISFDQLFREAYRQNDGDVYLSLLTMENILAKHWKEPGREQLDIIQRLGPISNVGPNGDKYGCWYHLIGMMLYGYAEGSLAAQVVGNIETAGSHVLSKFEAEWQENWINHYGGKIGGDLRDVIDDKEYINHRDNPASLSTDHYLNLSRADPP